MTDQTTPLTDEQLGQIEARATAATDGPWGVYTFGGDSLIEIAADLEDTGCGYRARRTIARLEDEPLDNDPTHREWTAEEDWAQVQADAAFIAHAPEDVAALLAEIRRLRAHLEDQANADAVASRAAQVISSMGADLRAMTSERNRYRNAWHNARARAVDARSDIEFVEQQHAPAV